MEAHPKGNVVGEEKVQTTNSDGIGSSENCRWYENPSPIMGVRVRFPPRPFFHFRDKFD
jgi:hypothetical protein